MKILLTFLTLMAAGCVDSDTAREYAQRAYPGCGARVLSHSYGGETGSRTEVQLDCDGHRRSVTVKCIHGFGIINDTVCHENN